MLWRTVAVIAISWSAVAAVC